MHDPCTPPPQNILRHQRIHRKAWNIPSHAHELTFSCYHRYRFLAAERTCLWLAESIDRARHELDLALWGYVFMPEHVHLILFPRRPTYSMPRIMGAIKLPVARKALAWLETNDPQWIARLERRRGRRIERLFWQSGGGYDRNITSYETLYKSIEYAHHNPVKRGLVARAIDWKWSSAAWYEGLSNGPLRIDPIE